MYIVKNEHDWINLEIELDNNKKKNDNWDSFTIWISLKEIRNWFRRRQYMIIWKESENIDLMKNRPKRWTSNSHYSRCTAQAISIAPTPTSTFTSNQQCISTDRCIHVTERLLSLCEVSIWYPNSRFEVPAALLQISLAALDNVDYESAKEIWESSLLKKPDSMRR